MIALLVLGVSYTSLVGSMFNNWLNHLGKDHYQKGCRDRDAGRLPQMQDSIYLDGYLSNRPEGLDGIVQYFPSVDAYIHWKH